MWKLPDWKDWLWGHLGLALMGRAMLSKSLIQFSVDWRGCVPSLESGLRLNYDRGNGGPSKELMSGLLDLVPLTPQQATVDPCLHWNLLDAHRQVWLILLWDHCSFLLGPGAHKVLFVPSKSLFP